MKIKCEFCNNMLEAHIIYQVPGFREREYLPCPWCGKVIDSSMEKDWVGIRKVVEENGED